MATRGPPRAPDTTGEGLHLAHRHDHLMAEPRGFPTRFSSPISMWTLRLFRRRPPDGRSRRQDRIQRGPRIAPNGSGISGRSCRRAGSAENPNSIHGELSPPREKSQSSQQCEFGEFSEGDRTTQGILGSSLSLGERVMLSILKKLYAQRGAARKENALYRGLDQRERALVPRILDLLEREGLAAPGRSGGTVLWVPTRPSTARVLAMLTAPTTCNDPLMVTVRRL